MKLEFHIYIHDAAQSSESGRLDRLELNVKEIMKMGQATLDKINELKTAFSQLGDSIAKEIQQLKDSGVISTDDPNALAALDELIAQAKGFKADLDSDDATTPPATT